MSVPRWAGGSNAKAKAKAKSHFHILILKTLPSTPALRVAAVSAYTKEAIPESCSLVVLDATVHPAALRAHSSPTA